MTTHAQPGAAAQGFALHLHFPLTPTPPLTPPPPRWRPLVVSQVVISPFRRLHLLPEKWRQDDETTPEPSNLRRDSAQLRFSWSQNPPVGRRHRDSLDGGETSPSSPRLSEKCFLGRL